ncbi:MAG: GYF domain-containing protein [Bacteroidales bacterium]|nr:GYF domain-containing protein [Bacteroidales bacterium]
MTDDNSMFDKIVEFGLGMTMARQFPQMMDMALPHQNQSNNTPPAIKSDVSNVYIANNGQQAGPFSEAEIKKLIGNGIIAQETLIWMPGMAQWTPANQVPTINKLFLLSSKLTEPSVPKAPSIMPVPEVENTIREDVVSAISRLGYSNANVRKIIDEVLATNPGISTEEALKEVLKKF